MSLSQHKLELAKELVDDVELSRLPAEQLLLKASRLARLEEDENTLNWLTWELEGYPNKPEALSWMRSFGRLSDDKTLTGYWIPLAGISGMIAANQAQIQTLQVPNLTFSPSSSNPYEHVTGTGGNIVDKLTQPAKDVLFRLGALTNIVSNLTSIRSRVLASIHKFAVKHYHELAFSGLAESIFQSHQARVDGLLAASAPKVLEKLPAVYDRIAKGDAEALSQAMNSIRRMIKAFADSVYPPTDSPREVDGQKYEIGSDKVLNRIKLYLSDHCESKTRVKRLDNGIRDIYDRASVGAHGDVKPDEARCLFLGTYITLGEILGASTEPARPGTDQPT